MKKYLINFVILLMLSLNAVSASEKDYGNLTEITLKKGLNEKQAREVAIGLEEELIELFKYWLTESHFINGSGPNIDFNVDFSAASVDLDNDNNDDLLVRVEHSLVCGVGDCDKIDILLSGDITGIKAGILGGSKYYVSDRKKHGLRYLFFEMDCRSDIDEQDICDFYMLEPTSSAQYSGAILVQKGRKVE